MTRSCHLPHSIDDRVNLNSPHAKHVPNKYDYLLSNSNSYKICLYKSLNVPFYHPQKTPASNAFTDLIRAILRTNATVQKSGTRLMRGTGITNARWQTLSELFAIDRRVTVSELARYMGLTRQAVQRLADDMARDGLVEFAKNPSDARAMHLLLTEAGKAKYDDALAREWQWTNAIAQDFDAEQLDRAVALLEAITQKMQIDD
jgi:DNA-binding MarR family transcriptional regulator